MIGSEKYELENLVARYPILNVCMCDIAKSYEIIEECYMHGGKVLVAGNGGSAADAEHIVAELMKEFKFSRPISAEYRDKLITVESEMGKDLANNLQGALPAIALSGHYAFATAYMNDCNPQFCFAQQVNAYGVEGDVFWGISTSGRSRNVLLAAVTAKALGMKVIGLTGQEKSRLAELCDICICAPGIETYQIQELHLPIYHCICLMLERSFWDK